MTLSIEREAQGSVAPVDGQPRRPWDGLHHEVAEPGAASHASAGMLLAHVPWACPLVESAIACGVFSDASAAAFDTPWGSDVSGKYLDERKHREYVTAVCEALCGAHAWFLYALHAARARVRLSPDEGLRFSVPTRPNLVWHVPGVSAITTIVPSEDGAPVTH